MVGVGLFCSIDREVPCKKVKFSLGGNPYCVWHVCAKKQFRILAH